MEEQQTEDRTERPLINNFFDLVYEIINPDPRNRIDLLDKDYKLGNIDRGTCEELTVCDEVLGECLLLGFKRSAYLFNRHIKSKLAFSVSINAQQLKLITTQTQLSKQDIKVEGEKNHAWLMQGMKNKPGYY